METLKAMLIVASFLAAIAWAICLTLTPFMVFYLVFIK